MHKRKIAVVSMATGIFLYSGAGSVESPERIGRPMIPAVSSEPVEVAVEVEHFTQTMLLDHLMDIGFEETSGTLPGLTTPTEMIVNHIENRCSRGLAYQIDLGVNDNGVPVMSFAFGAPPSTFRGSEEAYTAALYNPLSVGGMHGESDNVTGVFVANMHQALGFIAGLESFCHPGILGG